MKFVELIAEGSKAISIPQGFKGMPDTIMLAHGFYLEKFEVKPTRATYRIERLMDDNLYGKVYIGKRNVFGKMQYIWQMSDENDKPVMTKFDGVESKSFDVFSAEQLKAWATKGLFVSAALGALDEEIIDENEAIDHGLKAKAEKHKIKLSTLRAVFDRGLAAWRKSHRPGTNAPQWAYARVNSFLKGGPARKSDQDLWDKRND